MAQHTLTPIVGEAIELGLIPFNLFASDNDDRLVLFCKASFPITPRHKEILSKADRMFFIASGDMGLFYDYTFQHLSSIISNSEMDNSDKAQIVQGVGKQIVSKLLSDPRSGKIVEESGRYVESYIELILDSQTAANVLFTLSSSASYMLTHSINVCTFCMLLGEKLYGNDRNIIWQLGLGGLMHDLGMSLIKNNLLDRSGPLNEEEMDTVRIHPVHSYDLMVQHGMPKEILAIGRNHHEKADGSGYPDGLKLTDIHPFARIAAVVEVYDTLTSERSYRVKLPHASALAEMSKSKHLFDPKVFEALLRLVLQNENLVQSFLRGDPKLDALLGD